MGKAVSATDLLKAGRRHHNESDSPIPLTTKRLDDQSQDAGVGSSKNTPTKQLDDQSPSSLVDESPKQLVTEATSPLVAESQTYQRSTVFLMPDQRRWLKEAAGGLPVEGLSASDVVRLAVNRLRHDVDGGLPLLELLTNQAHAEAAVMSGRRNRGLPPKGGAGE